MEHTFRFNFRNQGYAGQSRIYVLLEHAHLDDKFGATILGDRFGPIKTFGSKTRVRDKSIPAFAYTFTSKQVFYGQPHNNLLQEIIKKFVNHYCLFPRNIRPRASVFVGSVKRRDDF